VDEVEDLHSLSVDLHSLFKLNTSIQWQKSRITWLKESDANSEFFHGHVSSRRRVNSIISLSVNGTQIEGMSDIRSAAFNHFAAHFKKSTPTRPSVENLPFKTISREQCGDLTKPFCVE
jgi:hypothetical protein